MSPDHEERLQALEDIVGDEAMKRAMKEALKEWLDEKFARFGRWSLTGLAAAAIVALVYFILKANGWHPPS